MDYGWDSKSSRHPEGLSSWHVNYKFFSGRIKNGKTLLIKDMS